MRVYWTSDNETLLCCWNSLTHEITRLYYGDPRLPDGKEYWEFGIPSWLPNGRIFLSANNSAFATPQSIGYSVDPSLDPTDLVVWARSSPQWIDYPMIGGAFESGSSLFWLNWIAESSDPKYAWNAFDTDGNLVRQEGSYFSFSNILADVEGNGGRMFAHGGWLYRPLVETSFIERFNPTTLEWQFTYVTNAERQVTPFGFSTTYGILCAVMQGAGAEQGTIFAWQPDALNWAAMPDSVVSNGNSTGVPPNAQWSVGGAAGNLGTWIGADIRWGGVSLLNDHVYFGTEGTHNVDFGYDANGVPWGTATTIWDLNLATGAVTTFFEIPYVTIDRQGNLTSGRDDPNTETDVWPGAVGLLFVDDAQPSISGGSLGGRRRFTRPRGW